MDRLSKDGEYNVAGLAAVAVAVLLTQVLAHGPWLEVALILGGGVALGIVSALVVAPISRARLAAPELKTRERRQVAVQYAELVHVNREAVAGEGAA
jgi:purine-cytosine permease-like protein